MKKVEHYAVLDSKGCAVRCGPQKYTTWSVIGGGFFLKPIKRNLIGNFLIETRFKGDVSELEGIEPCFWQVVLTSPPNPSAVGFLGVLTETINSMLARDAETIREALEQKPPIKHKLSFARREDALAHHQLLLKEVRRRERLSHKEGSEKAQALLAKLGDWCAEGRGRQSEVARAIGSTPQAVNDWLNGRKKMTGEQALRVSEFMKQRRRGRS
jgi:hypothetical protein